MNKKYHLIAFLLVSVAVFSQTIQEKTPRELYLEYLSPISSTQINSGFLLNRGFQSEDEITSLYQFIESYEEETEELIPPMSVMDGLSWTQIYSSILDSDVRVSNRLPSIERINERLNNNSNTKIDTPILVFDIVGKLLDENELQEALENSASSWNQNEIHLFGAMSLHEVFYNKNINFKLNIENYFSDNTTKPSYVYIDFSDGRGMQKYEISNTTMSINYSSVGEKVIKVYREANLNNKNIEIGSSFKINIKDNIIQESSSILETEILESKSTDPINVSGARAHIFNGSRDAIFDKPIIVVQGFDPTGDITVQSQYSKYKSFFEEKLSGQGYDLVLVLLNNTNLPLNSNTSILKQLIKKINNTKRGNFESIVIGESMGGLLSRMALKQFENENYNHQVGVYVSFDAPHQGANIPPGLQYLFKDALELRLTKGVVSIIKILDQGIYGLYRNIITPFSGTRRPTSLSESLQINTAYRALNALNSPAAKSMLVRHISPGTYFSNSQQYLNELGYPKETRNIALINGSNRNILQRKSDGTIFNPGESLVRLPLWRSGTNCNEFSFQAWSSPVNRRVEVSVIKWKIGVAVPDIRLRWEIKTVAKIFGTRIRTKVPVKVQVGFKCGPNANLINKRRNYTFDNASYDNAPGSTLPGLNSLPLEISANTCFVPTSSAIDLSSTAYNPSTNPKGLRAVTSTFALDNFIRADQVPFDEIYSASANTTHVFFDGFIGTRFEEIIEDEFMAQKLEIQDKNIIYDRDFEAKEVTIGNNINTIRRKIYDAGDVIVEDGANLTITAEESIVLSSGTHIKQGAKASLIINSGLGRKASKANKTPLFDITIVGENSYSVGEIPAFKALVSNPNEQFSYNWSLDNTSQSGSSKEFYIEDSLLPGLYTVRVDVVSNNNSNSKALTKVFEVKNQLKTEDPNTNSLVNKAESDVVLHPNPAINDITVVSTNSIKKIVVLNLVGMVLHEENIDKSWSSIDIESYPNGTYIVQVYHDNDEVVSKKFIKKP